MSCACGHNHGTPKADANLGQPITLAQPPVALTGTLTCKDRAQLVTALALLPDHIRLSRAEAGCLRFELSQSEDPLQWDLNELFTDEDAFRAHCLRTEESEWGQSSREIQRNFTRSEAQITLRPETPHDKDAIAKLLAAAFDGPDEARLVDALRDQGDLALSLVAASGGTLLGHIAFSPVQAQAPALALAPLAVHPKMQGRGIGTALVRAAFAAFPDHTIIVLGDTAYYGRLGFQPVDLASPYAGPHLMAYQPVAATPLPKGSEITHAKAFSEL